LASRPRALEGQVLKEEAAASGLLARSANQARDDITNIVNPNAADIDSFRLSIALLGISPNQVAFGNAIKRVRLLKMDPKMTRAQKDAIDELMEEIAVVRFNIPRNSEILAIANPMVALSSTPLQLVKAVQKSVKDKLKTATTADDMTTIYNFAIKHNALEDPTFRKSFLIQFQRQLDVVGRGEIRRIIGTGQTLDDDVALAVWQNVTGGGLRGAELLRSIGRPTNNHYANAIRTSYTKRELDEVGAMIREAVPTMTKQQYDDMLMLYSRQQDLIGKNAFNRVQAYLRQDQGEDLKVIATEIRRLKELPPVPYKPDPEVMRSRAKGVRKATDPSSSPIEGRTGGVSYRGQEGEMGLSQMRSEALNTEDLHRSYMTRAFLNRKARESSSVFTKKAANVEGEQILNVSYAEAGLRQPYLVGKAHDNVTVRMTTVGPVKGRSPKKGETRQQFADRMSSSSGSSAEKATANVGKLSPDASVDRVFLRDLRDDLTLMTRPESEFVIRAADGTSKVLARAPFTKASEGLPNNIPLNQVDDYIKGLNLRELQRLEMQHWVDRYGYRMLYDVRYARSISEIDTIAERMGAAFAAGKSPKGFYEILKATMSQRAAMLPQNVRYAAPGTKSRGRKNKVYREPQFLFKGKTSVDDILDYLQANIPAGGAARVQGRTGIQFPQ
jgi:hypothetical protein